MTDTTPSRLVEDYTSIVWKALEWPGDKPSTSSLADELGVTAPTVSANLKRLAADGYIDYRPYGAIGLTPAGREIAVRVVRRHRILETYLVAKLDLGWDQVHAEAHRLEHAVSDLVLDHMDVALGHPAVDPHGDPIPSPRGEVAPPRGVGLADTAPGATVRVTRVSDRDTRVLRRLDGLGIRVGTRLVRVTAPPPGSGVPDATGAAEAEGVPGASDAPGAAGPSGASGAFAVECAGSRIDLDAQAVAALRVIGDDGHD